MLTAPLKESNSGHEIKFLNQVSAGDKNDDYGHLFSFENRPGIPGRRENVGLDTRDRLRILSCTGDQ